MNNRPYGNLEIFLGIVGILITGASLYWGWKTDDRWVTARSAIGVVTGEDMVEDEDETMMYRGIVTYKNDRGDTIVFKMGAGSSRHINNLGQQVEVLYLSDNKAIVNNFRERWLGPLISLGIGLLLLGFVYYSVSYGYRVLRERQDSQGFGGGPQSNMSN